MSLPVIKLGLYFPVIRSFVAGMVVCATFFSPEFVEARTWSEIRDSGELRICTAGSSASFYQANAEAFARYLGVQAKVNRLADWDQQFHDPSGVTVKEARYEARLLADGQCDLYPNDLHITDWRQTKMLLVPYYKTRKMIVANRELRNVLKQESDLAGRRAAVQKGTAYEAWIRSQNESRFENNPIQVELAPTDASMQRVAKHLADFTVIGAEGAFKWVRGDLTNLDMLFPVDDTVSVGWGISVAATDLRPRLEAFFADSFRVGSELDRSWQRQYGISLMEYLLFESSIDSDEAKRKAMLMWVVPLLAGLGGMVLAMLYWTRRLQQEIGSHRKTAIALRQSEANYKELVHNVNAIILRMDLEGRVTYFNEYAEQFFGYRAEEILGQHVVGTIVPHQESATGRDLAQMVSSILAAPLRYSDNENENMTRDGRRVIVRWANQVIHDAEGKPTGVLSIGTDITIQKQAETVLRDSETKLRIIADNTYDWESWQAPSHGQFLYVSPSCAAITGYAADEFKADPDLFLRIIHPADQHLYASHAHNIENKGLCEVEFRILTKAGDIRWIAHGCRPVYGSDGSYLGRRASNRDVTATKDAELRIKESMERLEAAASAGIVGVWDWDVLNNRLIWDKVMYQLYGIREADFGGTYEAWMNAIHPDDRTYTEGEIQAALRGEGEYAPEFRVVWPDGSIHHIKAKSHTTFDAHGKPLRMIGVNYDITEQKNIETVLEEGIAERTQALKKARDAAEAANVAKSAFLSNMSHEMRTPLHHITGLTQMIRREPLTPKQIERIEKLETATHRLTAIIDTILNLTKIEADQFDLVEQPFSPQELLDEVLASAQLQASAKQLHLDTIITDVPAKLLGDKRHLKEALLNYVANAIRYTEAGVVSIRLILVTELGDFMLVRFEVEDSGSGIDPQDLPRLFNIFEQVDNSATRKFGGLGVGLAMTRKIAEIMGGEAGCDSRPGEGSTFWFTVRLRKV